jgi:hypothetical protein
VTVSRHYKHLIVIIVVMTKLSLSYLSLVWEVFPDVVA